jgi:hypothetical protein
VFRVHVLYRWAGYEEQNRWGNGVRRLRRKNGTQDEPTRNKCDDC